MLKMKDEHTMRLADTSKKITQSLIIFITDRESDVEKTEPFESMTVDTDTFSNEGNKKASLGLM